MPRETNGGKGKAGSWLRKRVREEGAEETAVTDVADLAVVPALAEFLVSARWPDGSRRQPGSVTIFVDQGKLKAVMNDRDQGYVCFVTVGALQGLWEALESVLVDGDGDWRRSPGRSPGKRGGAP